MYGIYETEDTFSRMNDVHCSINTASQPVPHRTFDFEICNYIHYTYKCINIKCWSYISSNPHNILQQVYPNRSSYEDLGADYAAFVRNWTPCHPAISSFNTSFTILCCLMTVKPLNLGDSISSAYMEPQPPLMSWTCTHKKLSVSALTLNNQIARRKCFLCP